MSRQRRTRYNFTAIAPGEFAPRKIDVLTYSRERALEVLAGRGYTEVEEHRKPTAASRSWQISDAALTEAKRLLGIDWPVKITVKHSEAHMGICRTSLSRRIHRITLKPSLGVEKASIVLWHELGHAAYDEQQTEHYGPEAVAAMFRQNDRRYAYENRPNEKFARSCEANHFDHFPLTRGA